MAEYLLDTSALIDWLGGSEPAHSLLERLSAEGHDLAVCCVSIAELFSGLSDAERAAVEPVIGGLDYLDIDEGAARLAGSFRYTHARRGMQLSTPDALQAALAVRRGATLVTANVKDFPMPELRVEEVLPG